MAPMLCPWRSLKFAMDLRALVTTGFCPVMAESCSSDASRILPFWMASPSPMFTTTFSTRGACIGFLSPNSLTSAGRISFSNLSFRRAAIDHSLPSSGALASGRCVRSLLPALLALLAGPHPAAVLPGGVGHAGGLAALRAHHHDAGGVDGAGPLDDPAVGIHLAAPLLEVALHGHELLDADPAGLVEHLEHLARLALLLAGEDLDGVVLADVHGLQHLRREADDLHELAGAQLAGD